MVDFFFSIKISFFVIWLASFLMESIVISVSWSIMCLFFPPTFVGYCFWNFYLSHSFQEFYYNMSLRSFLWCLSLFGVHLAAWTCVCIIFNRLENFSSIISLNIFLFPLSLFLGLKFLHLLELIHREGNQKYAFSHWMHFD